MITSKNYPLITVSIIILMGVLILITPLVIYGQEKLSKDLPVKITTVNAKQSGTWNVGITDTLIVKVNNSKMNPVPIYSVSEATQPIFASASQPFPAGTNALNGSLTIFPGNFVNVPAGKRLVVEFVTVSVEVPSGQKVLVSLGTTLGNASLSQRIAAMPLLGVGGSDVFMASQTVRLYADPNSPVTFYITRIPSTGAGHAVVTISGYLVDLR